MKIYTLCSRGYRDAYDFVIGSWLKQPVDEVVVFTDFDFEPEDERVKIRKVFELSDDWLINVGRKVGVCKRIANESDKGEEIIFIDVDCYLNENICGVFELPFDIAVTRLKSSVEVSSGIFFWRNNNRMNQFFEAWGKIQSIYFLNKYGVGARKTSYSQNAFDTLVRKKFEYFPKTVLSLDVIRYNRKVGPTQMPKVLSDIRRGKVKVFHFYNNSYRDAKFVKMVFEASK